MKKAFLFVLFVLLVIPIGCLPTHSPREKYVKENADQLADIEKQKILAGKLYIGMPKEAVLASIGRPARINADFLGHQVVWYYDYDRNFGTRDRNVFKTTFIVEFVEDKVFNWRED